MKTKFHALILPLLLVLLLPLGATAAKLDGIWKGPLKMPGGELEVIFRLVSLADGSYFAMMDVPLQKVSRMAVKAEQRGDTVTLAAAEAGSRFTGQLSADGKQIIGTWHQPGLDAPLTLTFTPVPVAPANAKVRLTPPYREEEVNYTNVAVNQRLSGMLTIPAGPGPFPAVVLVSDAGAHDREGTVGDYRLLGNLADYLTRRGIAVLRFDDRGIAGSAGDFSQTKIEDLITDVQAGINFLRARPEIDFSHIGLIGHGEGGNVALLTAAQPLPPAFVVALAAAGQPGTVMAMQQQAAVLKAAGSTPAQVEAAIKQQTALLEVIRQTPDVAQARAIVANMLQQNNPTLEAAAAQAKAIEMTSARYRLSLQSNPLERLGEVKCPVLLLNGTADLDVQADPNLASLTKALRNSRDVTSKKLPGVNHLFQPAPAEWPLVGGEPRPTFSPAAEEAIRAWVVARSLK
ncbi:alpha/beta hydrolase family protein [Hymenobacter algoricola]|uniref:Alpha/beta fold hydrolase n=1 Tax=Hymenobacter algoricola TaxID=486267 RepID=A0ABP7NHI6_9BACT